LYVRTITRQTHSRHTQLDDMKSLSSSLKLALSLTLAAAATAAGQTFVGTNAPGAGTNYTFTTGAGATNLSLVVSNSATVYSYLLLKFGGTPTDTVFDFAARLDGQTNEINLEVPEYAAGSYGLRVSTPAGSATHAFSVVLTTNRTDLRSAAYPVLKPLAFSVTSSLTNSGAGAWHYFQVDVPSNLLTGWRIVLSASAGANPDLYLRRGALPTQYSYDRGSAGQRLDTLTYFSGEATTGTYFIGVFLPAGPATNGTYTLTTELMSLTTLTWDPGTADAGTQVFTNQSPSGGEYYFKITTQTPANQAWRSALKVLSGEADLYLRYGAVAETNSYNYASTRVGSDGFVLGQGYHFNPGQDWYLTVHATPGAQWTLLTGEAYVQQLPPLAPDASSGATATISPEGMRFFKTTISSNTLAWRLGLNVTNALLVSKTRAPLPIYSPGDGYQDWQQPQQMLLVPPYLNIGDQDLVGVIGNPGQALTLDSRQQPVADLPFAAATNLTVTGYAYTTFRVQVPIQQIAWQINLSPTNGDANLAVRRDNVPNEYQNDAFSELAGSIGDSVTLVPPTLSDGTFYITVYGATPHSFTMTNGQPIITDVHYIFQVTNDAPARAGWRYYRVPNTAEQLGTYGWDLELTNQFPNTEIALRRNAVPGRWNYRNCSANCSASYSGGNVDYSGTEGFLQRPGHQADIWYVGVYQPAAPLGSFVLSGQELTAAPLAFDPGSGTTASLTNQPAGKWQYFIFNVPTNALGWDLRLNNVSSGDPRLTICRDRLPYDLGTHAYEGYAWHYPWTSGDWPSGYSWAADYDWTGYYYDANAAYTYGKVLQMGMGNPLAPGTYYVGVLGGTTTPLSYTLLSRGIGTNFAIPVGALAYSGGLVSSNTLPAREAAYYRVDVPSNAPSWKLRLAVTNSEAMFAVQKDFLPNVVCGGSASTSLAGGRKMQNRGNDQYLLLPMSGQSNVAGGTYYVAVVSEGQNPGYGSRIGSNYCNFTIQSLGPAPTNQLGTVDPSGLTDIIFNDAAEGGEIKYYNFSVPPGTLSLEVHLDNRVANPYLSLRADGQLSRGNDGYGQSDGVYPTWSGAALLNLAGPALTNYTLAVQAGYLNGTYPDASYTIRLHALGLIPVAFDGGTAAITNQVAGTWQYFTINVPTNALGWDVRLTNVTSGDPRLVIRRAELPDNLSMHTDLGYGWDYPWTYAAWPDGYQWAAGYDWTGYDYDNNGTYNSGRLLEMGLGNPLSPGIYYVGVYSGDYYGAVPMTYALLSRGIGTGFMIPVPTAPFIGNVTNSNLTAREAAYYRVDVPPNQPNWRLRLACTSGEALLMLQQSNLPNVVADGYPSTTLAGGRKMQKAGNEHYLLLPVAGQTTIPGGTYYVAAASEGLNPYPSGGRIGSNACSFVLSSYGPMAFQGLGAVGAAPLVSSNSLEAGDIKVYQFTVPPGTPAVEVLLDNRLGNPGMTLRNADGAPTAYFNYGYDGGQALSWYDTRLITLPNVSTGLYTLTVMADPAMDASYTLRVSQLTPMNLAFDASLSGPGITNVASGSMGDQQMDYYRVTVPVLFNGQPVLGWKLDLDQASGTPQMRVRKDLLPVNVGYVGDSPYAQNQAVMVPPFLTPGTWYVEVQGQGATVYTLRSSALLLERPAWPMPAIGQSVTTPGLPPAGPLFGDTGVSVTGTNLPGDQGVDLAQGAFHYYAISIPSNNVGIIRTRLDAISGNSDLYIRAGGAPTLSHYLNGDYGGYLYDRYLNVNVGSEYGNWVPLNGRDELQLTPGTWYLAVQASGNSNVRYRLRCYTGTITPLAFDGVSINSQTLAAGDWRHYQVTLPTNCPTTWNVTFNQNLGDVVMYVRDVTPPGQGGSVNDNRDWASDAKNHGPYPNYDSPSTYALPCPPLRPGQVYYLGFRAVNDATFSVSCTTNTATIDYTNTVAFYGGYLSNTIPPNGVLKLRVDVPGDARRMILNTTNAGAVAVYLEQGSVPTPAASHYSWSGNYSFNLQLYANPWPWYPGYMYFLLVTNTSGSAQPFALGSNGKNSASDDYDGDGLPDAWELACWPSIYSYNGTQDPDGSGVSNTEESLEGTVPCDAASYHPRLLVSATFGTVTRNPMGNGTLTPPKVWYLLGANVQLTATPDPGYSFVSWTGDASGSANPLNLTMSTNKTVTANLAVTNTSGADYQFQLNLNSSVGSPPPLQNIGAGNVFTTENVDGCPRTVLTFPLGNGVRLQPTTGVIPTNIYTVVLLFRFDAVSGWQRILDFKAGTSDFGLYCNGGQFKFYPVASGPAGAILAGQYVQVVLTRDATGLVTGYVNGVQQFSFNDATGYAVISSANDLRFFKDGGGDNGSGAMARIRLYNLPMPGAQVALLDRTSCAGAPHFLRPWFETNVLHLPVEHVIPGVTYRLLASTNLNVWLGIATNAPLADPTVFTDPGATNYRSRMYRLVTP
jgi:hypothetical protein